MEDIERIAGLCAEQVSDSGVVKAVFDWLKNNKYVILKEENVYCPPGDGDYYQPSSYKIVFLTFGKSKIKAIVKLSRFLQSMGRPKSLSEIKFLIESGFFTIHETENKEEAEKIRKDFEEAGVNIMVQTY